MNKEDARRIYDLRTVVARYTQQDVSQWGIVCPMPHHHHHDYTPSFVIYRADDGIEKFFCFGNCGAQGDVIDFAGFMHLGAAYDPARHLDIALAYLRTQPPCPSPLRRRGRERFNSALAEQLVKKWEAELRGYSPAQAYLENRGVLSVAEHFHLGYRRVEPKWGHYEFPSQEKRVGHYISIPTIVNGQVVSVKFRRIDALHQGDPNPPIRYDSLSGPKMGRGQLAVFNHDHVAFKSGDVFSPEGEMDIMLLHAAGALSCGSNSGSTGVPQDLPLVLSHTSPIWIADPDEVGLRHAEDKRRLVGRGAIVRPPTDIGSIYAARGMAGVRKFIEQCLTESKNSAMTMALSSR